MKKILLSFDVEEFDLPREHGVEISLDEGLRVSEEGLLVIMDVLEEADVRATFFVTGNFAEGKPELVRKLVKDGHEVACHGVDHFYPKENDICESKKIVEKVTGTIVKGWRQPRMGKIDYDELKKREYLYDSSVNPAFVPGRYNNTNIPRRLYSIGGMLEIPVSVTGMRVPMFWLALHWLPFSVYCRLARKVLEKTGYFATYLHPWEFADLSEYGAVPGYIKHNSGVRLKERLTSLIDNLMELEVEFVTYGEFAEEWIKNKKRIKKNG